MNIKKLILIVLICIIPSRFCLAAGEAAVGISGAAVAMSTAALVQADQNKKDAIKAKNATLIPPPMDWAIKNNCELQATENIGEYKCFIHQGLYEDFYLLTVNSKGNVVKTILTNNNSEANFWLIFGAIIIAGIAFLIYKMITY
jgi:hypothetical protein